MKKKLWYAGVLFVGLGLQASAQENEKNVALEEVVISDSK